MHKIRFLRPAHLAYDAYSSAALRILAVVAVKDICHRTGTHSCLLPGSCFDFLQGSPSTLLFFVVSLHAHSGSAFLFSDHKAAPFMHCVPMMGPLSELLYTLFILR